MSILNMALLSKILTVIHIEIMGVGSGRPGIIRASNLGLRHKSGPFEISGLLVCKTIPVKQSLLWELQSLNTVDGKILHDLIHTILP